MGKDRYSDDHTIEVVGDSQTLTVDENLSVVGDAAVGGNASVTGTLGVTGATTVASLSATSLTSSNGLTVSGPTTLHNTTINGTLQRSGTDTVYASYVVGSFSFAGVWSDYAAQFVWTVSTGGVLTVPGGSSAKFFQHCMTDLPNGATITALHVFFEPVTDTSGFEVTASIAKMNLLSGAVTTVATATATTGTAGVFQIASTTGLSEEVDYNLFAYIVSLKLDPAVDDLKAYVVKVVGTVSDYD